MIDLESLVPERCKECEVARILVRKKVGLLATCARIIEADFDEGAEVDLASILTKTSAIEEEAAADIRRLVQRCEETTDFFPEPGEIGDTFYCRMPPSDWREVH